MFWFSIWSLQFGHLKGRRSCTFLFLQDFVAKTQNLSVYDSRFEEFMMPSLSDFVDGDREEMLLCASDI